MQKNLRQSDEATSGERRGRRVVSWVLIPALVLAVVGLGGAGWVFSSEVLAPVGDREPEYDLQVLAADGDSVTLPRTPATENTGVWGLDFTEGYGRVGEVRETNAQTVVRDYEPLRGEPASGTAARLDGFAYPGDPEQAHGIPFREVEYTGELGDFPAWEVPAEGASEGGDTWAIMVHGRGSNRGEALRLLPTVREAGLSALVISYRNDPEAPASPDGLYQLGQTEWRDLEAAAEYAFDNGAGELVLVGNSMGGAIVAAFLRESEYAPRVRAAILDAPVLDWSAVLDFQAEGRGLPQFLTRPAERLSTLRTGIDWGSLDQVSRADEFETPMLLFHGPRDAVVPVATSDAFATARPDLVTYHRPERAGHVEAWNVDPDLYESQVREFLDRELPAP